MKRTVSIKIYNLMLWLLFFALYKPMLLVNDQLITVVRFLSFLIVLVFLFLRLNLKKLFNQSIFLCLIMICSGIYNCVIETESYTNILYGTIIQALSIYETYTLFSYYYYHSYIKELFNCLYKIVGIYCVGSIISMLLIGHSSHGTEITYIWGNKFTTSYLFITFVILFLNKYWKKITINYIYKIFACILVFILIKISIWLYCSTTTIASFFLLLGLFFSRKIQEYLAKPKIIILYILLSSSFVFLYSFILENWVLQQVIQNILNKSLSLTGRVQIFEKLGAIIINGLWLGYGYGNSIIESVVGYGNAQNGLMQIIINYGIFGMIAFLKLVYSCMYYNKKFYNIFPIYLGVYALILCALVEISFNNIFFMMLFLIYWHNKSVLKNETLDKKLR